MEMNFIAILVAAVVPTVVGFIWYNPKVFGTVWMKESGVTEEKMKNANMAKIFILSFIFSFMFAMGATQLVIHQNHFHSVIIDEPGYGEEGSDIQIYADTFMDKYGGNFRTFKHGMAHGFLSGIFILLPIIATNALFERRSWKYIFINLGYWVVTLMIVGGIVCGWR